MDKNKNLITDQIILNELEDVAEHSLNKHIENKDAKEWFPGEVVPFYKAQDTEDIDDATKSAIYINGLTEDNLAHYTSSLKRLFGSEGAWGEWNNRWTWEESLHGRAIERYIDHTGIFDSKWIESARKVQITSGQVPEPESITEIAIYASVQEELTRLAHSRLSQRLSGVGRKLFALIAGDELRHHHFYNTIASSVRQRFPDEFALSLSRFIKHFDMPGTGIPGYKEHSEDIENAGIFTRQDVAKAIGDIATKSWSINTLIDEVCEDKSKQIVDKLRRRLEVYKRMSTVALQTSIDAEKKIKWLDGKALYPINDTLAKGEICL